MLKQASDLQFALHVPHWDERKEAVVTYIVQCGLTDGVIFNAQHLHHLLHLTEDLRQRNTLGFQLILDFGMVSLLRKDRHMTCTNKQTNIGNSLIKYNILLKRFLVVRKSNKTLC